MNNNRRPDMKFDVLLATFALAAGLAIAVEKDLYHAIQSASSGSISDRGAPDVSMAPAPPHQFALEGPRRQSFEHLGYELTPRAGFEFDGLILRTQGYYFSTAADIMPLDAAIVWGPLSAPAVANAIEVNQSLRFARFRSPPGFGVNSGDLIENAVNMHFVPANEAVRSSLEALDRGDLVRLRGRLVDIRSRDGMVWRSSLVRDDTGRGACEVVFVEAVEVISSG